MLLGVSAVMALPHTVYAAKAPTSTVGIVDYDQLFDQHPDIQKSNEALKVEQEQAKQEYDAKSPNMTSEEKKALEAQLQQRVGLKQQELIRAIEANINDAVKAVSDEKGITMVLPKKAVVYGGQDITKEVLAKILGK